MINLVHNETLILLEHLPPSRRLIFWFWALFIGTRESLGLIQWLRLFPSEGKVAGQKLLVSWRGRWLAHRQLQTNN